MLQAKQRTLEEVEVSKWTSLGFPEQLCYF